MKSINKMQQIFLMDGVTEDFMDRGHVCFNCEQIFANRKCLEDHVCPKTSFICSCGTEFTLYNDMLEHSVTHEPGHQVLDHRVIKKRRFDKYKEEEAKLKRLQKGDVIWNAPSVSGRNTSANTSQLSVKTPNVKQVPEINPSLSEASLSNTPPSATDTQKTISSVGAPTVDLWTLYQPVVLLKPIRKFPKPYTCGKCGQGFMSKVSLTSHSNSHVADKVCGCIGCGLLLSSRKFVPRFHTCTSPTSNSKFRLITAKPPHFKSPNVRKNLFAQQRLATSAGQLKNHSPTTPGKGIQVSRITSVKKNINIKTYKSNITQGAPVRTLLQPKRQNAFKAVVGASKSSNSNELNQIGQKHSVSSNTVLPDPANQAPPDSDAEFKCRVCHLPFKTPLILQRHKCIKAQEFMAKHLMGGKSQQRFTKPAVRPISVQVNGNKKPESSPSVSAKKNPIAPINLDKGKSDVPVNGNTVVDDDDDDCYIVEGGSEKPAEVIYQVTSSVPIKS